MLLFYQKYKERNFCENSNFAENQFEDQEDQFDVQENHFEVPEDQFQVQEDQFEVLEDQFEVLEDQFEVMEDNSQISPHLHSPKSFSCQQSSSINEEQNFWEKKQNQKYTLCPCTKVTPEDVMLMCLTIGLRHNLTWQAQIDILKMINAMYGEDRIPSSKYMYLNHIDRSDNYLKYHIFCPECERYYGNTNNLSESVDCNCGHTINVSSLNYFLSIDLESQFKTLFKNTVITDSLMTYRFNRSKINDTALEDIYDGAEYKKYFDNGNVLSYKYNFSYSFNTDGVPMGKSCGKTIWPIYITINELLPKERSKHVLLAGLYVGKKDPNQNVFLQPFVEQANKLSLDGFQWNHNGKDVISKAIPLCAVVDSVARFKMLNMSGINAYYACTFCYQKAEHTVKGQRFSPCIPQAPKRTTESTRKDIEKTYAKRNECNVKKKYVKGVKGPTPLLQLNFFNLIAGFVPDYMHCILLGVIRLHTELLFDSSHKKFWKVGDNDEIAMKHIISAIDERFTNVCALTSITRSVRSLSQISIWKASEWRSWLIFYCVPCLKGFLKNKYLKHLAMLSKATSILLQKSITRQDVVQAHKLFLNYIFLFNQYFGVTSMVLNVHLLIHIAQSVLNWGPLWTHNAFVYEGQNRYLLQLLHSPNQVVKQIARKFVIYSHLPILYNELISTKSIIPFCENVLQKKLQHYIRCEGVILLGKKKICTFSPEEYVCVNDYNFDLEHCTSFKRMLYNGIRYCSADYVANKKHNDSFILTYNEMIVVIKKIINVSHTKVLLLVQEVVVEKEPLLSDQDFKYTHVKRFIGYGKYFFIQPSEIEAQCVFIDLVSDKYLCKMPFGCYGD
jgi:hypothetical protein